MEIIEEDDEEIKRLMLRISRKEITLCDSCDAFFDYIPRVTTCNECKKKKQREYARRPEVKAKVREYRRSPEVKAMRREYARKYRQSPEGEAKVREYEQRLEVKAMRREYEQRPEVKAKRLENHRKYRRKKKLREEE